MHVRTWTHDLLLLKLALDCCILLYMLLSCACSVKSVWERAPAWHGKCSMFGKDFQLNVQYIVWVLLPPLPLHEFPSIQGIISLLKYQTLGIIRDGNRNQNFKFFPRSERLNSSAWEEFIFTQPLSVILLSMEWKCSSVSHNSVLLFKQCRGWLFPGINVSPSANPHEGSSRRPGALLETYNIFHMTAVPNIHIRYYFWLGEMNIARIDSRRYNYSVTFWTCGTWPPQAAPLWDKEA